MKKLLPLPLLLLCLSARAQCPEALPASGLNLAPNGDFETAATGWFSGYDPTDALRCAQRHATTAVFGDPGSLGTWPSVRPKQGQRMLLVNGATDWNSAAWATRLPVRQGRYYWVEYWLTSLSPDNRAMLQLKVDGNPVSGVFMGPAVGNWQRFSTRWQSPYDGTATFALHNLATQVEGNDFALDAIRVEPCGPEPPPLAQLAQAPAQTPDALPGQPEQTPPASPSGPRPDQMARTVKPPRELQVQSATLRVRVLDNMRVDGDSVSIAFNGQWLVQGHAITHEPLELLLTLLPGQDNDLVLHALNLGQEPPNTASLEVHDGTRWQKVVLQSDLSRSGSLRFGLRE